MSPEVQSHEASGVGVYHYFRDFAVVVESGISAPTSATFTQPLGVFLNGLGTVKQVIEAGLGIEENRQILRWCNCHSLKEGNLATEKLPARKPR